jgi:3-hydroxyacyl-[acyl-carrier-protein] dehydratase
MRLNFMPAEPRIYSLEEILNLLPHRPPFLFVDRVVSLEPNRSILAERLLRPEEPQFTGHFPGQPMMPGVLIAEALAQASGLLLGLSEKLAGGPPPVRPKMFFLAATNIKFQHPAMPGDLLSLRAVSDRALGGLFRFNVEASVAEKVIATGALMLAEARNQQDQGA